MPADIEAPAPVANFLDSLGRRVTAEETRSGLLVILARAPVGGLRGGHPALNREQAGVLGAALAAWANEEGP